MHFRFDHYYKKLLRKVLSGLGEVRSEMEVAVDAQRIDIHFQPALPPNARRENMGMLGRMAESACLIEPFHGCPDLEEMRSSVRKLLASHHLQVLQAKKQWRRGRARFVSAILPAIPVLWILTSGQSSGALEGFAFQPLTGWPSGMYTTPQSAIPVRLVVASELPENRDTLWLRLMGRGAVQRRAAVELAALPPSAWERRQITPLLVSLQKKISKAQTTRLLVEEEKEILVTSQQMIDAIENKGLQRGREETLTYQLTRKLGRPLTAREHATFTRRLQKLGPERIGDVVLDFDPQALATWLANPRAR